LISAPFILLIAGALGVRLAFRRRYRLGWAAMIAVCWLALTVMLLNGVDLPRAAELSAWRLEPLVTAELRLAMDQPAWAAGVAMLGALLTVTMTAPARSQLPAPVSRAASLVYTAIALGAAMAGNVLTLLISWMLLDLSGFLLSIQDVEDEQGALLLSRRLAVDLGGIFLVNAAFVAETMVGRQAGQGAALNSAWGTGLLLLGGFLRLGLFPLHFLAPTARATRLGLGTLMRFFPPAVALLAMTRFLPDPLPGEIVGPLRLAAVVGAGVGATGWLLESDKLAGRPFLVLGFSSTALLVGSLPFSGAREGLAVAAAIMILIGVQSSLIDQRRAWTGGYEWLAAAAVIGLPGTLGGLLIQPPGHAMASASERWTAVILMIGMAAIGAGMIGRAPAQPEDSIAEDVRLVEISYHTGLLLPLALSALLAVPLVGPGFRDMAVFAAMLGLTAVIRWIAARLRSGIRARLERQPLHFIPSPYPVLWRGYRWATRRLRASSEALEGAGGILWIYAALLLLGVLLRGGSR
jgi:hypothetical protein